MYKVAISTALALGLGIAAASTGNAAAVAPASGMQAALAQLDSVQLAQVIDKRVRVRPGGGVVRRYAPSSDRVVAWQGAPPLSAPAVARVMRGGVVGPGGGRVIRGGVVGRPAFVRSYRPWVRRPHFGTILGGIALGSILTVAAVGVAPAYAPAPDTCWYWADPVHDPGLLGLLLTVQPQN